MIYLPVIPYVIGLALTLESPRYPLGETTFVIQINTLFTNTSAKISASTKTSAKRTASLSFDMKCTPFRMHGLRCYIEERSIRHIPSYNYTRHLMLEMDDKVFTPLPFNYSSIPFDVIFTVRGPAIINIEKNINITNMQRLNLLMMYQMIWYHLSIGVDIKSKGISFKEIEKFTVGICPVLYNFTHNKHFIERDYKLSSLINDDKFKFYRNKTVDIVKHRFLNECSYNDTYIFGEKLWTGLIPTSNLTVRPETSETVMSFAEKSFHTVTKNLFYLYDNKSQIVSNIREQVTVLLTSAML